MHAVKANVDKKCFRTDRAEHFERIANLPHIASFRCQVSHKQAHGCNKKSFLKCQIQLTV